MSEEDIDRLTEMTASLMQSEKFLINDEAVQTMNTMKQLN